MGVLETLQSNVEAIIEWQESVYYENLEQQTEYTALRNKVAELEKEIKEIKKMLSNTPS